MLRKNEHIGKVGERRAVGDDPGEGHLQFVVVHPETKRILKRFGDDAARNLFSPIRLPQKTVNHGEVDIAAAIRQSVGTFLSNHLSRAERPAFLIINYTPLIRLARYSDRFRA